MGYDPENNRVMFTSYDNFNRLNYYTGRAIYDSVKPRYQHAHVTAYNIVFNEYMLDYDDKDVYLVEGTFDLAKTNYADKNVICILGSNINTNSYLFRSIISHNNVYLCLDRDAVSKMITMAKNINGYGKQAYILDWKQDKLNGMKDIGEMKIKCNVSELDYITYNDINHLKLKGNII